MKSINDYNKVTHRLELKKNCLEEAINMVEQNSKNKNKFSKKRIIPVFAAIVVGCGVMATVFADDIANVFRKAENKQQITAEGADGERYTLDKSDQLNYTELEKHAVSLNEEYDVNGLKIKAESIFCDGENITIMFTAENNNSDITDNYRIWAKGIEIEIGGKAYNAAENSINSGVEFNFICDYEGASTYTGTLQIPLAEKNHLTETTDVNIHISYFESTEAWDNGNDLFNEYCKENNLNSNDSENVDKYYSEVARSADFQFEVTPDTSSNSVNSDKYSDQEIEVAEVKSTPYALSVKYKTPMEKSLILMVYDQDGNRLELNLENQGEFDGEYQTSNFSATDSEMVTLNFVDKNSENLDVVSSFEIEIN